MISIFISDSSYIVRKGIGQLLNELDEVSTIFEYASAEELEHGLSHQSPDIIITNTAFDAVIRAYFEQESEKLPIVLNLFHSPLPHGSSEMHLSLFENKPQLMAKIQHAIELKRQENAESLEEELSPREKLVLKHVALGKTNKEIADSMFISTHTVISHRKNITKKLGIKTVSGLTVYAILNKLIGMEDVS